MKIHLHWTHENNAWTLRNSFGDHIGSVTEAQLAETGAAESARILSAQGFPELPPEAFPAEPAPS